MAGDARQERKSQDGTFGACRSRESQTVEGNMNNKRKFVLVIVGVSGVVFLSVGVGWFGETHEQTDEPFCSTVTYNGNGTVSSPYEVENVHQLQCIDEQGLDANYVQVSDIDASKTSKWNDGEGFEPIGDIPARVTNRYDYTSFGGKFDGQGYAITNLQIDRHGWAGLFGVNDGEITNVSLSDAEVTGFKRVGGLVGFNYLNGTISESHATGDVDGDYYAGGLVGLNRGTVSKSHSTVSVSGIEVIGGLTGSNGGTISGSYALESVRGDTQVGGLVGYNTGTVNMSYATGGVRGTEEGKEVGGLVGYNHKGGKITKSYATEGVYARDKVGGLVGRNRRNGKISKSYATGSVTGNEDVGGLVGSYSLGGKISESYATGEVRPRIPEGYEDMEGVVGYMRGDAGEVSGTYWDIETTGQSVRPRNCACHVRHNGSEKQQGKSSRGIGLNTSQMTGSAARDNMYGFDFTNTWETVTNPDDYPALAWEKERD